MAFTLKSALMAQLLNILRDKQIAFIATNTKIKQNETNVIIRFLNNHYLCIVI